MRIESVRKIVEEAFPKIVEYYGHSKWEETTPWMEYEESIYGRLGGEEDDGTFGEQTPHAEYDRIDNSIIIYYPKMVSKKHIIQTLVHEYQHYLQSPLWMKRYYTMGYHYGNHPYEIAAYKEEENYKMFL